jgi:hypothetical protein
MVMSRVSHTKMSSQKGRKVTKYPVAWFICSCNCYDREQVDDVEQYHMMLDKKKKKEKKKMREVLLRLTDKLLIFLCSATANSYRGFNLA